ncbi:MAG: bifunctional 3,4-dihydroxy-2-butanone-4-phosphate synthase/GTP cyclohydrolase II [Candidatus Kapaibacterium sp.]
MTDVFDTIEDAIRDIAQGKFVVVLDDEDRENEGDLLCAASLCTPEHVTFMSVHGRGLICTPVSKERAVELGLQPMVRNNSSLHETNFTVSIDYIHGTTTGISSPDRSATIRALAHLDSTPDDFGRPGHVFPIVAADNGVLRRAGHTEAAVDLSRLAGTGDAGVICEIVDDDGTMARAPRLHEFARRHGLRIITIKDLIAYRLERERSVACKADAALETDYGTFRIAVYQAAEDTKEHVALVKGDIADGEPVLVRVHSECMTGDVFHSKHCDCGAQLDAALRTIGDEGRGVVLYMRQEGRGIGLVNKIRAYQLQAQGMDTVEANVHLGFKPDAREYGIGAQILYDLGVRKMRLLTNNPTKRVGLSGFGLETVELVPIEIEPNDVNQRYMETKKTRMGHILRGL